MRLWFQRDQARRGVPEVSVARMGTQRWKYLGYFCPAITCILELDTDWLRASRSVLIVGQPKGYVNKENGKRDITPKASPARNGLLVILRD